MFYAVLEMLQGTISKRDYDCKWCTAILKEIIKIFYLRKVIVGYFLFEIVFCSVWLVLPAYHSIAYSSVINVGIDILPIYH